MNNILTIPYYDDVQDKFSKENTNTLYLQENILIQKPFISKEESDKLIALDANKGDYIGYAIQDNNNYQRERIGRNLYSNGDLYIGNWINDLRHQAGFYLFNNEKNQKDRHCIEYYNGNWNMNNKHGFGSWVWIDEQKGNNSIEANNMHLQSFIGLYHTDKFNHGLYMTKDKDQYFTYYGKFDPEGRRNDTKALVYDNLNDKVFRAKFDKRCYNMTLTQEISSETSGDYKKLLLALVASK